MRTRAVAQTLAVEFPPHAFHLEFGRELAFAHLLLRQSNLSHLFICMLEMPRIGIRKTQQKSGRDILFAFRKLAHGRNGLL